MRTIAIMNQKGGVGKTTTSVNLAAALARRGKRVLLIDMDPQAHASLYLGMEAKTGEPSVYDVMTGDAAVGAVCRQAAERLWVVPSHLDLAGAEVELAGEIGRERILRGKLGLERTAPDGAPYDYQIIDCPPSLGVLTINALTAAREIIIPLQPHFLALHGLGKLLQTIKLVVTRLDHPELRLSGVVFCLYDAGTTLAREVSNDIRRFFADEKERDPNSPWADAEIYRTKIRRNIRLAEAPSYGESIFDYDPKSNGADDYADLAAEVDGCKREFAARNKAKNTLRKERVPSEKTAAGSAAPAETAPAAEHSAEKTAADESAPVYFAPNPLSMEID